MKKLCHCKLIFVLQIKCETSCQILIMNLLLTGYEWRKAIVHVKAGIRLWRDQSDPTNVLLFYPTKQMIYI